jgi:hypothetical protein
MNRLSLLFAATLASFTATIHLCSAQTDAPTADEVKAAAEEAYIYGLPMVMAYTASYEFWLDKSSSQYKSPMGELTHSRRVFTYEDTAVIVPNSDTPYSFVCLDLRAEPWVVSVPDVEEGRYFSVQLVDWNAFNFGYIGSRTTGNGAGDFLVVGPDWKGEAPAGTKGVLRSSSQFCIAIIRTQLFGPDDMANVAKIQDGYQARPLSAFLKQPATPAAAAIDFPKANAQLAKENFFGLLEFVMQVAPPGPEEKEIRAKLARIGVGPKKKSDFKDLPPAHKAAALEGVKAGMAKVQERAGSIGKRINGWQVGSAFGNRDFYKGDWLLRAAAAQAGIFGNNAEEAVYPMTRWLPDGEVIDTSKNNYEITFPAGKFPPAKAFWSVTIYDGKSQLLIKNPINRYLINSPMLSGMKKNDDGSITLHIRKDSPGADKESNWLPAPDGPVYLVMRLYWPQTESPSILPPGEGDWAPPAVQMVK